MDFRKHLELNDNEENVSKMCRMQNKKSGIRRKCIGLSGYMRKEDMELS